MKKSLPDCCLLENRLVAPRLIKSRRPISIFFSITLYFYLSTQDRGEEERLSDWREKILLLLLRHLSLSLSRKKKITHFDLDRYRKEEEDEEKREKSKKTLKKKRKKREKSYKIVSRVSKNQVLREIKRRDKKSQKAKKKRKRKKEDLKKLRKKKKLKIFISIKLLLMFVHSTRE